MLNQLGESPTEKELTAMFKLVFSLILNNKHSFNNVLDYKVFFAGILTINYICVKESLSFQLATLSSL